jgi:hypothetical protein
MNWNYRLIDLSHENGGEPWVELHEVFYEDDGSLMGYAQATTGGEDLDDVKQTLTWMLKALEHPVLRVEDFKGDA